MLASRHAELGLAIPECNVERNVQIRTMLRKELVRVERGASLHSLFLFWSSEEARTQRPVEWDLSQGAARG